MREVKRTEITSLKIGFNNVFGYYLEVRHAHKDKVPEEWIRKQTLTQAEKYITEELKVLEAKILDAKERALSIEHKLYEDLVGATVKIDKPTNNQGQIKWEDYYATVLYNSNTMVASLTNGVPVFCDTENSAALPISETDFSKLSANDS